MVRSLWCLLLPALGAGRIVTVHNVYTPPATTIQYTLPTTQGTTVVHQVTKDVTVFVASTSEVTLPTGTINTEPISSGAAPVSETDTYSTTAVSTTINPETYSSGFTVITSAPNNAAPSTSSASSSSTSSSSTSSSLASSSSTSNAVVTSPEWTTSQTASQTTSETTSELTSSLENGSSTVVAVPPTTSTTTSTTSASASTSAPANAASGYYPDGPIFGPIDTAEPLSMFAREPIPLTIPGNVDQTEPLQTNKFFANTMLDGQNMTVFAQPYGVFWSTDESYYGLGVSYTNASQRVFGQTDSAGAAQNYLNPLMLKSFVLSAVEFSPDSIAFGVSKQGPFSVQLSMSTGSAQLTLPVAIGMGVVTGVYNAGATPRLFSQLGVQNLVLRANPSQPNVIKYTATLFNGMQWNIYVTNAPSDFTLSAKSNFEIVGSHASDGIVVQVAVIPPGGDESAVDSTAGAYAVGASIGGSVSGGNTATYSIDYETAGTSSSGSLLLYALPHHVSSFSAATSGAVVSSLVLDSPTKGTLTGVVANSLVMEETLNTNLQWLVPESSDVTLSSDALKLLASVVNDEIAEDMVGQTHTTSTYTAGKGFDKFAYILLVANNVLQNKNVTAEGLSRLQAALAPWLSNTQPTPFIYDTLCKGLTSSAANAPGGSPNDDFGAPFYNDHHFHYGYYIHAAAVIAMLDQEVGSGDWLAANKDWVNSLVRDVANPSSEDTYFPVSRMFDYYSGHSWAHGMFVSGDGKDEESTSEDYNFAYGMKLWGKVSGDHEMEARGDLMLAILSRSMNDYFYYTDSNTVQPSEYIANRVAGITFENKLDHTTYFGTNLEYIQGIHMIPLTGASVLMRSAQFAQQEWNSLLAPIVGGLNSGWAGILRANQALFDPVTSWNWFAQDNFSAQLLDGGASRSWYLAFAALLGGSS